MQLVSPPVWAPDSARLAFTACDAAQRCGLYTYAIPSWQPVFLTDWSGYNQCELPPALAPTLPEAVTDWLMYTNLDYGFTFRYPPDWSLEPLIYCVQLWQDDMFLDFCFRHPDEQADYLRTGVPAGDFVHGGHISFFSRSLFRSVLVFESKVKATPHPLVPALY